MGDLNLALYHDLCERHLLEGLVRHLTFEHTFGGRTWDADLEAGAVTFAGEGARSAQVLGTFDPGTDSFLWGWANPGAAGWAPGVLAHARHLRERGEGEAGLAAFREPKVSEEWVGHHELGLVASALAGQPLAIRDADGPQVLFLIDEPVDPVPPPERWFRILTALGEVYRGSAARCLTAYLAQHGTLGASTERRVVGAVGAGAELDVRFDERGRLTDLRGAFGG